MLCLTGVICDWLDGTFVLYGEKFGLRLHLDEMDEVEAVEWIAPDGEVPPKATQGDLEDARAVWENSFHPFVMAVHMYGRDPLDKRGIRAI